MKRSARVVGEEDTLDLEEQRRSLDLAAWERELKFMRRRMRLANPGTRQRRTWTREELYEDRLGRRTTGDG